MILIFCYHAINTVKMNMELLLFMVLQCTLIHSFRKSSPATRNNNQMNCKSFEHLSFSKKMLKNVRSQISNLQDLNIVNFTNKFRCEV